MGSISTEWAQPHNLHKTTYGTRASKLHFKYFKYCLDEPRKIATTCNYTRILLSRIFFLFHAFIKRVTTNNTTPSGSLTSYNIVECCALNYIASGVYATWSLLAKIRRDKGAQRSGVTATGQGHDPRNCVSGTGTQYICRRKLACMFRICCVCIKPKIQIFFQSEALFRLYVNL